MSEDLQPAATKKQLIPVVLGLIFGAVLIALVLNGGMCERYNRKMERQRYMRQYLESQRSR